MCSDRSLTPWGGWDGCGPTGEGEASSVFNRGCSTEITLRWNSMLEIGSKAVSRAMSKVVSRVVDAVYTEAMPRQNRCTEWGGGAGWGLTEVTPSVTESPQLAATAHCSSSDSGAAANYRGGSKAVSKAMSKVISSAVYAVYTAPMPRQNRCTEWGGWGAYRGGPIGHRIATASGYCPLQQQ